MSHALTTVALFVRREDAKHAATSLIRAGLPAEDVGYLEPTDVRELKNPAKGAVQGIAAGGTSGGVIGGILAAVSVGLLPGIGEVRAVDCILAAHLVYHPARPEAVAADGAGNRDNAAVSKIRHRGARQPPHRSNPPSLLP